MSFHEDESDDLLDVIADRDAEIQVLHDEMQELLGSWLFAEEHGLRIADMTWIEHNNIEIRECPDGEWELTIKGWRVQKAASVRTALEVLRAFMGRPN
jgi:hypothetical protein